MVDYFRSKNNTEILKLSDRACKELKNKTVKTQADLGILLTAKDILSTEYIGDLEENLGELRLENDNLKQELGYSDEEWISKRCGSYARSNDTNRTEKRRLVREFMMKSK